MKKLIAYFLFLVPFFLLITDCKKEETEEPEPDLGQFTDSRDGQVYKIVAFPEIGQTWMAENLNFDIGEGCWFYDDDPRNGARYGRLYTWEAARKACPPGWRLPTDEEWKNLADSFGEYSDNGDIIGDQNKSYQALIEGGNSGFSALPGGYYQATPMDIFFFLGYHGFYWSATEIDLGGAWGYKFDGYYRKLYRLNNNKTWGFSCRCIQD
ncbi:MAG: hypothetical protein KDD02_07820 [Phaeodactylibacter sp.]|nr:hypothetical protein [Phaeodactylibacter sp.]MCB9302644.1 hypothetical protein [Lewinellaceae bacterium]